MARLDARSTARRRTRQAGTLPFSRSNYLILGIGLLVIFLGYVALSQEPWDSTMALVVAPILLVAGYCVLIPLGILYRRKSDRPAGEQSLPAEPPA